MRHSASLLRSALMALVVAACSGEDDVGVLESAVHVEPDLMDGNPSCESLGFVGVSYKLDPPASGTFALDDESGGDNEVTVEIDGLLFSWSSTIDVDIVIVKGGPNANVYTYDPEEDADSDLHAPVGSSGQYSGLSHIELCFDYELDVDKTAETFFERDYEWTIDKSSTVTQLELGEDETYEVPYTVDVDATYEDGAYGVRGTVTVHNPTPFPANITGIVDELDGTVVALDCGSVTFPYVLLAGAHLECEYEVLLGDEEPTGTLTNVVEVTAEGIVCGDSASAVADFADAEVVATDECITVDDSLAGELGTVCAEQAPKQLEYTVEIGPFECGETHVVNEASFVSNDTEATGSDTWSIHVVVACEGEGGCTLSWGYWKTHSSYGPAPYDDTWAELGEGTMFFLSGQTYYEVLQTSPRGNAYYILAHQFIAASLNVLSGASLGAVSTEWAQAEALFEAHTPAHIGALEGGSSLRAQFLQLAGVLDDYNNGHLGPGYCSE